MSSPIGLHPSSPSSRPSMFSKKKSSTPGPVNASAYLAAVADADRGRRAQSAPSSAASINSTPALSLSSSITGDSSMGDSRTTSTGHYFDLDDTLDAENDETGLTRPSVPPTSEEVFATRHVEFGHDAHPEYRYTHEFTPGERFEPAKEEEPPYYILLTTYLSYLIFIVIGHTRDFFGMRISPQKYKHLMPNQGLAALTSDFDSFYTRRIKIRVDDLFARPVTGVAGRTIVLLDRLSTDYNRTYHLTGTRTRALNVSSYNYLGFAQARGGCADAVEQGIRRYGLSACGSRLECGTTDLHLQAEALVAKFIGAEDALITSMGYATNSTTIPAVVSKGSLILSDEHNHASIRVGVRLGGAVSFGASGGYIAGSKELISRLRISTHAGPYAESMSPAVLTQVIASMSSIMAVSPDQNVGSYPSPAPRSLIPTWLYDQLTPALRDGSEGKERSRRLAFNSRYLSLALERLGFIVYGHADSPIIPLLVYNPGKLIAFSRMMLERKTPIIVVAVGYPATSLVAARLRFCLSAAHTKEDVDTLLRACDEIGTILDVKHGIPRGERWTIDDVIERSHGMLISYQMQASRSINRFKTPSTKSSSSFIFTTIISRRFSSSTLNKRMPPLDLQHVNPQFKKVEYAVRGELAIKAERYKEQLKTEEGQKGLKFNRVVNSNIGNPQQKGLDQKPLTFGRQVAALLEYPPLMESGGNIFPADAIARAKELYDEIGSIGAYSHSQGVPFIRKHVAEFIQRRDGHPSNPNSIFLTAGASAGVDLILNMLISSPKSGILIPIPQYPLYTACLARHAAIPVPYYLDESKGWSTEPHEVERAIIQAHNEGTEVKALVVINPGNPTGGILDAEVSTELVKLAEKYELVLLADEVYQDNVHDRTKYKFTSFKKLVCDLNSPVRLVSFHSISKGVTGECGRRGGYFECTNFSDEVIALIYKMVSVSLCPPLGGQIGVDCLVRPPKEGEPSYALWKEETSAIHEALASRTKVMTERLNALPGMSCAPAMGALYLYPKIELLPKQIEAAKKLGKAPDMMYALELLDETGICAVPGSGFGQKEGEGHFRLTCLCAGVEEYIEKLEVFHKSFYKRYGPE
ncbi:hypothetical protein FRB97_006388 [Tulasnella sp. 331]|nr:hypothetical protein FRB97_006388 [Tulasnella sp. 331]